VIGVLASVVILRCLVAALALYAHLFATASAQGALDPEIRRSTTYTPDQGPSSPFLLDSRPDVIMRRYLADYVRVAGTYPSIQDLTQYGNQADPVLLGEPCPVTRPVASYVVTSVTIVTHGFLSPPEAFVRFIITYADGNQWADDFGTGALHVGGPWPLVTHLDCWSGFDSLYPDVVPDIPRGISYGEPGEPYYCKDHSGHVIFQGGSGHFLRVVCRMSASRGETVRCLVTRPAAALTLALSAPLRLRPLSRRNRVDR
jgi:hypothetical protein